MVETDKINNMIDDKFKELAFIGEGGTGIVLLAEEIDSKEKVAIKILKSSTNYNQMIESFKHEINIMVNLSHKNIIKIFGANSEGKYIKDNTELIVMYICFELAINSELFDYIADYRKAFSEHYARYYFKEMISGLNEMHKCNIAHRDLKLENLFLNKDFQLKIGDFGFSKFLLKNSLCSTYLGSKGYQSPELLEGHKYDGYLNDIFSCGVILFILCVGHPPFKVASKNDQWYVYIYLDKPSKFWDKHKNTTKDLSRDLKLLIFGMLKYKERWTLKQVKNSTWYLQDSVSKEEMIEEMTKRKVVVDKRRAQDNILVVTDDNLTEEKVFRSLDDFESIYKALIEEIENNNISIRSSKCMTLNSKKLTFENCSNNNALKLLCYAIDSMKGEINLDNNMEGYRFNITIKSIEDVIDIEEDINTTFTNSIQFSFELFKNLEIYTIIAEFINSDETDSFTFRKVVDSLKEIIENI